MVPGGFRIAALAGPPDWWIGAGVIRDIVWDTRFGKGFDPSRVRDIDLGFFDDRDLRPERNDEVEADLHSHNPLLPWDVKNQAAVHLWYPRRFGVAVAPFQSAAEAVATFPEFATCVAVRLGARRELEIEALV